MEEYVHFSAKENSSSINYKLLTSTVLPRPIAFVTSVSADGILNAAPFSFFNAMGSEPPVIALGFEPKEDGSQKDTPNNILQTQEFVVNIVSESMASQMNIASGGFEPDVNELEFAELKTLPSVEVQPPRIELAPVSLECQLLHSFALSGGGMIILGEVLHFHLKEDIISGRDPLRINLNQLAPISRLNGALYGRITDQFTIQRPKKNK